jgi:hypothetical protein
LWTLAAGTRRSTAPRRRCGPRCASWRAAGVSAARRARVAAAETGHRRTPQSQSPSARWPG